MSEAEQERETSPFTSLSIDWHIPENAQSRYANNVLVQSTQHEIIISFFETKIPPLIGTPLENAARLQEIGSVRADLVSRIIVAPGILPAIISALQTALETHQEAYSSMNIGE